MYKTLAIMLAAAFAVAALTMATTTSLGAATPAFAEVNCHSADVCTGGDKFGGGIHGGHGGRAVGDSGLIAHSGGSGSNTESGFVGGHGGHEFLDTCDTSGCTRVGGSGTHTRGPGGNSDK